MSRFAAVAVVAFAVLGGAACEKSKDTAEEAPVAKGSQPKSLPPPPPKAAEPPPPVAPPVPDPTGGDHDGHAHGGAGSGSDLAAGSGSGSSMGGGSGSAAAPADPGNGPGGVAPATPGGPGAPMVGAKLSMDTVRPPEASDLAFYLKGIPGKGKLRATIDTSLGSFHCELYEQETPITVANFVGLATGKKPWLDPATNTVMKKKPLYNGLIFHRVIPDFMVQGGDPLASGAGGPGYNFDDEIVPSLKLDAAGILAMANAGSRGGHGTNGSQFFITEKPTEWLTVRHTVFGKCDELDLVTKITSVDKGPGDRPTTPVVIKKVTILRK